jgi:hypothetical protein
MRSQSQSNIIAVGTAVALATAVIVGGQPVASAPTIDTYVPLTSATPGVSSDTEGFRVRPEIPAVNQESEILPKAEGTQAESTGVAGARPLQRRGVRGIRVGSGCSIQ